MNEKREDFLATLVKINSCKTIEEINELREYVKDEFLGYELNSYFWHCRDRFNKVLHQMNSDLIV